MNKPDWSVPQRQSAAGLVIIVLHTVWSLVKRFGLVLIVIMLSAKPEHKNNNTVYYLIGLGVALVAGVFNYLFFRYNIEDNNLIVRRGWLNRSLVNIPIEKIQSVQIEQDLLHRIFNVVELEIDTAGSTKTELSIRSLRREMAEALRQRILEQHHTENPETAGQRQPVNYMFRMSGTQLMRLSLSANHLETFVLLFLFMISSFDEIKLLMERMFPGIEATLVQSSLLFIIGMIIFMAVIVVAYSTVRVVLNYYNFRIRKTVKGYLIQSGLLDRKERMIAFRKMQYISWHANWLRHRIGIYLMEFHTSGDNAEKAQKRIHTPMVSRDQWKELVSGYHSPEGLHESQAVHMNRSFFNRRALLIGIIPCLALCYCAWYFKEWEIALFSILPAWVVLKSWFKYRRFQAFLNEDCIYIRRSSFGVNELVLRWRNVQFVSIHRSPYLRSRGLSTLRLHTASGTISLPYIDKELALQIADLALYKLEAQSAPWI